MDLAPESEAYPIVNVSWVAGAASKPSQPTGHRSVAKGGDSFSQQAVQPAKAAYVGIYTASGRLDAQSRLAQTLREAKEKKGNKDA